MRLQFKKYSSLFILFSLGIFAGFGLHELAIFKKSSGPNFHLERLYPPNSNHLINPLMQVEGPSGGDSKLDSAKKSIQTYINGEIKKNDVSSISVYLRNLNQGNWIGVNEDTKFTIASLAKVPLMFTFFLKAQQDPSILNKQSKYEPDMISSHRQNILPKDSLQVGSTYSVQELLRDMIAYSDNTSMFILAQNNIIDADLANQIYLDLHLPVPRAGAEYEISTKDYARYFRLLYSASYLNKDSSEKALKLLTETDFKEGLVAGVPENTIVAHKFGERDAISGVQLHDCGIVYYPETPYLLCVMTKGWNFETLKATIKNISEIVYGHIAQTRLS